MVADQRAPGSAIGPARLAALWEPGDGIVGVSDRRRARAALALILALSLLALLNLLISAADEGLAGVSLPEAVLVLGLGAAYGVARVGNVRLGIIATVLVVDAVLLHFRFEGGAEGGEVLVLYFLAVPILFAGLLLPVRPAILIAAGTILAALAIESHLARQGGIGGAGVDIGLLLLLLAVASLSVVASTLNERDAQVLYESQQLLRQITENLPEVFFLVAGDGSRALYTSPAYEAMTGRTVQQSLADPLDWIKAVHPDDLSRVQAQMAARDALLEYRIVQQVTGEVKHVRARTFPVLDAQGRVVSLVGIVEDITATVVAQERLAEAQRQRIHLLQQLAHDLASPLSPVKIHLHLMKARIPEVEQKNLAIVERNVAHVQRLVEDVKDVARLEGGGLRLERRPIDLSALARQTVETLTLTAAGRGVTVTLDAPAACPLVADPGRLTQVLYNLVGNALKFTPPDGRIDVRVTCDPAAVVSVRDTGGGMTPEQLAKLFKPFSQVHDADAIKRPEDKGSGLGLYISKGIVEAHGGRIEAASAGPGQGSTFTFTLPLAPPTDGPV